MSLKFIHHTFLTYAHNDFKAIDFSYSCRHLETFFATSKYTLTEPRQVTDLQSGLNRLINSFLHLSGSPAHTVLFLHLGVVRSVQ